MQIEMYVRANCIRLFASFHALRATSQNRVPPSHPYVHVPYSTYTLHTAVATTQLEVEIGPTMAEGSPYMFPKARVDSTPWCDHTPSP